MPRNAEQDLMAEGDKYLDSNMIDQTCKQTAK